MLGDFRLFESPQSSPNHLQKIYQSVMETVENLTICIFAQQQQCSHQPAIKKHRLLKAGWPFNLVLSAELIWQLKCDRIKTNFCPQAKARNLSAFYRQFVSPDNFR